MRIIQFENEEPKTRFAPTYCFHVYENKVEVGDIRETILSKEKEIINSHPYTNDWNTGLGPDSMTSRSNCYNLLKWDESDHIRDIIRNSHDNMITTLDANAWEDKIYVQCWANVLRKGQHIKQHQHWNTRYSYLGGHICLDDYETHTHYVNPYNRKTFDTQNKKGKIYLFPNWLEHYTDTYDGDDVRITIAFDIITQTVYDEDIFDNMKEHWVQL
ncbi:hypothetical cyanophage protein [Synechococcus phage S-RSM4]|uniref:Hypothetical cyanophage protein n=1 Tax=Synechococcus phage S-RSM4 TaxID=555387 RepID=C7BVA3_9CAUD|nr:2OG-Fe(II) oxygenase [Synechococcus phage S-RSM4]CAR63332.1 hypothetical cyanophage protein [Synechococcus phage S-RSM4]